MTRPPLVRDLTLEEGRAAARSEAKLLLVDVMGDWCAPCRHMDATTWRAPEVEAWVRDHAVAIQIDSEDPAVRPFNIQAVPTMLLFEGDELLDRITGSRSAKDLFDPSPLLDRRDREVAR